MSTLLSIDGISKRFRGLLAVDRLSFQVNQGDMFAVIGPNGDLIDPLDGLPTGLPVVRGGGWDQSGAFQRVSARYSYYGPTLRVSDIGFRVVRQPVAQ